MATSDYTKSLPTRALRLPAEVEAVLNNFYTCEYTTVNKSGQPITWPSVPFYYRSAGTISIAVSIAFPVKAYNVRRHPQVSLLFSDPTGSGLDNPPAVLVQADTVRVEEALEYGPEVLGVFKAVARRQPDSKQFYSNRFIRSLFVWYLYQRIEITVRPTRLFVWESGDFSKAPEEIVVGEAEEVNHVE